MFNKLYILPFDHRTSFIKMFGFTEQKLTAGQTAILADYKHLIYEAFLAALGMGVTKKYAAIMADEQFGKKIIQEAGAASIVRMLAVEKSGQDEFDFEYGDNFKEHINKLAPEYVKALVHYNPADDKKINVCQRAKLRSVSDFCRENDYKFLLELLAEPLSDVRAIKESMRQLQADGIEPDVWKIEGLDTPEEMREIAEQAQAAGRKEVGVVILGRGESDAKVKEWLRVAAGIPGVAGFAVGRTVFKQALLDYHEKTINRARAVKIIAENYKNFVDFFEKNKK